MNIPTLTDSPVALIVTDMSAKPVRDYVITNATAVRFSHGSTEVTAPFAKVTNVSHPERAADMTRDFHEQGRMAFSPDWSVTLVPFPAAK